ncbi:MAG: acyclic terpene utilization AtuA family protein [Tissierellia bacterium]|nr:acyclic terpene utilization AtuA family protein [Tissierellia bacterium]
MDKIIRIGGGQGFWGDSPDAAIDMVKNGNLNYLACDYLAELTMSILQRQKNKNPKAGYARDFISLFDEIAKESYEKKITVISNAGGVHVEGAVKELAKVAEKHGLKEYKIGYVLGDDMMSELPRLMKEGYEFINSDDGSKLKELDFDQVVNANVYFGHEPIVEALEKGANTVVTGRAADSALFLSPAKYEFEWSDEDYDNIARGIIVGHLLECGGQAAGGNFDYGWRDVPQMDFLGFPIAELTKDQTFITKTSTSGGLITEESLKEQLLYEIHDPSSYITPDITADISHVELEEIKKDRVEVKNIKGRKPPENLKLTIGYHAGYKVETYLNFAWPDAYEKAQYAADIIMKKMKRKNLKTEDLRIDFVGLNALHLNVANLSDSVIDNQNEVIMRIALRTKTKEEAKKIIPEIAPLQLNGPPGSSFFGGRARVQNVIGLWPTFVPRDMVRLRSHILEVK